MWMKIKKLHDNAVIPHRAHDTDAGLDVCAIENGVVHAGKDAVIRTGFSMALPDGWVAVVKEKSGRATKNKITVGACVIDSSYRGEVLIHLFNNDTMMPFTYGIGEKLTQLVIVPCWTGQPVEVEDLDETERGEGRMGSTGNFAEGTSTPAEINKIMGDTTQSLEPKEFIDGWNEKEKDYLENNLSGGIEQGELTMFIGGKNRNGQNRKSNLKPLAKNLSTPEGRKYWKNVDEVAKKCPQWMKDRIKKNFKPEGF